MAEVVSRMCECPDCDKVPSYGMPGDSRASRCNAHKLEGMVDVKNRPCDHAGCSKLPSYGLPGATCATRCAEHKLAGMIDVRHRTCDHAGCVKLPSYGVPGDRRARRCAAHKLAGMVDVKHRTCDFAGCAKLPSFGMPGDTRARRCALHRLPGMVGQVAMRTRTSTDAAGNVQQQGNPKRQRRQAANSTAGPPFPTVIAQPTAQPFSPTVHVTTQIMAPVPSSYGEATPMTMSGPPYYGNVMHAPPPGGVVHANPSGMVMMHPATPPSVMHAPPGMVYAPHPGMMGPPGAHDEGQVSYVMVPMMVPRQPAPYYPYAWR